MSEPTPDGDDRLDALLRTAAPSATPRPEVRARHHSELDAAIADVTQGRAPGRGRWPRVGIRPVAAAAVVVVVFIGGLAFAARDDERSRITAADVDDGTDVPSTMSSGPPLVSAACGGDTIPFTVPVLEGFAFAGFGPAPGAPAPSAADQLVAHWSSPDSAVEVRWPADVSEDILSQLGQTEDQMNARLADGMAASTYVSADLNLDVIHEGNATASDGLSVGGRPNPPVDGNYELSVTRYEMQSKPAEPDGPRPAWGDGLCSTVQLTVSALDGRTDVSDVAAPFYRALIAPGGPLVEAVAEPDLVVARTQADALEPPSECRLPPGVDQDPVRAADVTGPGPFPTADEALLAYLETLVATDDGPFGPEERPTAAMGGYTAVSLPDGRVGFKWPDQGNGLVGHFIAEQGPGGWSVTRTEGPSC